MVQLPEKNFGKFPLPHFTRTCLSEETLKAISGVYARISKISYPGVNLSPVLDSIILPGQKCLHDADQKQCKGKNTSFVILSCIPNEPRIDRNNV